MTSPDQPGGWQRRERAVALSCFFLSGFAGLVYEICWVRIASLVFGSTTIALSTVLAVFFGGLAIGSAWFGGVAQRTRRPLRLYAVLEVLLAAVALATPLLMRAADGAYGALYRELGGSVLPISLVRAALLALVLLPPTVIMGATLPLFCRQFVDRAASIGGSVGFLYGVNTLGAAAGCAAAGFVLVPMIGVQRSIVLAAGLNVVAGVVVWWMERGGRHARPLHDVGAQRAVPERGAIDARVRAQRAVPLRGAADASARAQHAVPLRGAADASVRAQRAVPLLFFFTGLVALGTEVLWTRFLALLMPNTVYTYTTTLTVVLLGIVMGAWLAGRLADRTARRGLLFGALQVTTGLALLATLMLPARFWQGLTSGPVIYALLLLPTAVLSGASFPLAVRMVLHDPALAGVRVGVMAAVNTAGGIVGALLAGFVGLPLLGLDASVRTLSGASIVAGIIAWIALRPAGARRVSLPLAGAAAAAALAWFAIPLLTGTRLPADFLAEGDELVAWREGMSSNLAVVRKGPVRQLQIDRWWQGEDRKNHQFMAAHVPMLLHDDPSHVLVVGVGTGQTLGRFLMHEGVAAVDCVDIEPALMEFVPEHFDAAWLADERLTMITEDGRSYISHTAATYDVISLEIGQLFRPGVATFYSEEFYRRAAARLEPGGILSQFVPLPFLGVEDFRRIVRAFTRVFPQSVLWYNTSELLLLGMKADRFAIDPARFEAALGDSALREDLQYSYWDGPERWLDRPAVFFAGFLCGPDALAVLTAGAPSYHDDRPVLEYATARPRSLARNEIPIVELLRPRLERIEQALPGGDALPAPLAAEIASIRDENVNDILAQANLRVVELAQPPLPPARAIELLQEALRLNPRSFACHRQMADAQIRAGNAQAAHAHLSAALAMRPDDPPSNRVMAYLMLAAGRITEAVGHARGALRGDPTDASAHNYLGAALAQRGDLPSAIHHFEQAARLAPDDESIRANLARARSELAP